MVPAPLLRTLITSTPQLGKAPRMSDVTFDRSVLGFEAALLLETLLDNVNAAGQAQMSNAALMEGSGLKQGPLIRARTELIANGLLRIEPSIAPNGLRGPNVYHLDMPSLRPVSRPVPGGESGQNQTEQPSKEPPPAVQAVRGSSADSGEERRGFLGRLLRRHRGLLRREPPFAPVEFSERGPSVLPANRANSDIFGRQAGA